MKHLTFSNLLASVTAVVLTPLAYAGGETITVTTLHDATDFGGAQQVANLPGSDGVVSFREAVIAANNTAGAQTIAFAIPQSEFWLMMDRALLEQEFGIYNITDDFTTVDFSTQTLNIGNTNPNGNEVGIYGLEPNAWGAAAIYVNADHCIIKGLDRVMQRGYGVRVQGHNNRVIACTIEGPLYAGVYITGPLPNVPATGNIVGGTEPAEANSLSGGNCGVRIDGPAENNIVIGNFLTGSFSGAEVRSASCCPGYVAVNNRIGGPTPAERNHIAGAGHYGEEGFPTGSQVSIEYAVGTIVEGNYIGTTANGNGIWPNQRGPGGVDITNSTGTVVRNNLISGIAVDGVNHYAGQRFGMGIAIEGNCSDTIIENNKIGTNATGDAAVPNYMGIGGLFWPSTPSPTNLRIGGTQAGQGNLIAFNETWGVLVQAVVNRIRISGNSIHSNGGLGIDLMTFGSVPGAYGPTPNDVGDADTGGNGLQNYPVVTAASGTSSQTIVSGTLNSIPNATFALEFFASSSCDSSGFGEGAAFLGTINVTTNASGNATFNSTLPVGSTAGQAVTATATNAQGDTSEFSACFTITGGTVVGDITGDGVVNVNDLLALIQAWGACQAPPATCPADLNGDGMVSVVDLLMVINNWT